MISFIRRYYNEHKAFVHYLLISAFVTVVDICVSKASELITGPVIANTMGVVTGFIIQYILVSRKVYNKNNMRTFIIFLLTFLLGLVLANSIVYASRVYIFDNSEGLLAFAVSKGLSIVLPFFVTYFLRKRLIGNDAG